MPAPEEEEGEEGGEEEEEEVHSWRAVPTTSPPGSWEVGPGNPEISDYTEDCRQDRVIAGAVKREPILYLDIYAKNVCEKRSRIKRERLQPAPE